MIHQFTKQFEVGQVIGTRSPADYECIFWFEVMKRTSKTVTIKYRDKLKTVKINQLPNGHEYCHPLGRFSLSPMLMAGERPNGR